MKLKIRSNKKVQIHAKGTPRSLPKTIKNRSQKLTKKRMPCYCQKTFDFHPKPKKLTKCTIYLKQNKKVLISFERGAPRCHHARTKCLPFLKINRCITQNPLCALPPTLPPAWRGAWRRGLESRYSLSRLSLHLRRRSEAIPSVRSNWATLPRPDFRICAVPPTIFQFHSRWGVFGRCF